jgi:hypothetical protein
MAGPVGLAVQEDSEGREVPEVQEDWLRTCRVQVVAEVDSADLEVALPGRVDSEVQVVADREVQAQEAVGEVLAGDNFEVEAVPRVATEEFLADAAASHDKQSTACVGDSMTSMRTRH